MYYLTLKKYFPVFLFLLIFGNTAQSQDTTYHPNGEGTWMDISFDADKKQGYIYRYAIVRKLPVFNSRIETRNGNMDGVRCWYYEDSVLAEITLVYKNVSIGPVIHFNPDGTIMFMDNSDSVSTNRIFFGDKGNIKLMFKSSDSLEANILFHDNGKISGFGQTQDEDRVGYWVHFDSTYKEMSFGKYMASKKVPISSFPVGIWRYYNFKGEFIREKFFNN